tara:strand:+ start:1421 stop:3112 length:1692 start_codon:yes stop_codon:yes gene_type:complete
MCGIYCYISVINESLKKMLDNLSFLEYRGYDSVGIFDGQRIVKTKGNTDRLKKMVNLDDKTKLFMGHTRWATHGIPSKENSHPHMSQSKRFVLIQNGIVENFQDLKTTILSKGYKLKGDTDTEILVNFIDFYYKNYNIMSIEELMSMISKMATGSFSVVYYDFLKQNIYIIKKNVPLYIGELDSGYEICSTKVGLSQNVKNIIKIKNNSLVCLNSKNIKFTDSKTLKNYTPERIPFDKYLANVSKESYKHFMIKEIMEQASHLKTKKLNMKYNLSDFNTIVIGACGSSYYASLYGKILLEEMLGISVIVEIASEFIYRKTPRYDFKTLFLFVSQSGETADILSMVNKVKNGGYKCFCICNVLGSTLSEVCDDTIYMNMGPEIGVASTKSFTGQMMCFLNMVNINTTFPISIINYITERTPKIKEMAKKLSKHKSILIMGRKYNYPIALEGALKLKEITYIHTEGFSASEMKHGVIALVDESLPILYMLPNDSIYSKNSNNYEELKSRKANIFMLGDEILNNVEEHLIPFYYVIELQLLTYYIGLTKGTTIDKPRNLAKSVTVE